MDFCLLAYSEQFHLQTKVLEYLGILKEISTQLGVPFTHMDYALIEDFDDGKGVSNEDALIEDYDDDVGISNETNINPESINLLEKKLKDKHIFELAVWSLEDEKNENSPDNIHAEVLEINPNAGYKYAYIHFPIKRIESLGPEALFTFVSNLVSSLNNLGRLDYALVAIMKPDMPQTYFRDIFAPGLNEDEAANLAMWNRREGERKIRLRGLYWGNLLGCNHLLRLADQNAFKQSVENLVGRDQITTINGDDLFFMQPFSNHQSGVKFDKIKELLIENDLLMQPNEEDIREARRFLSY